jgi:hypothetical protein
MSAAETRKRDPIYLQYDPFDCPYDETKIECRSVRIVKTRKEQTCVPPPAVGKDVHAIPAGTEARCERALVEGSWSVCYTCLDCMDIWLSPPFEGEGLIYD